MVEIKVHVQFKTGNKLVIVLEFPEQPSKDDMADAFMVLMKGKLAAGTTDADTQCCFRSEDVLWMETEEVIE